MLDSLKNILLIYNKPSFLRIKVLLLFIYLVLEVYYFKFITDYFNHLGFVLDFNTLKYFFTKIIFLGFVFLSYFFYSRSHFLYVVYLIIMLLFYIPNAIYFSFSNGNIAPFISNVLFVSIFAVSPYIKFNFPVLNLSNVNRKITLFILSIGLLIPLVLKFNNSLNLNTLFLKDIYSTRELFSEKLTGYLGYIYNFEVKTIIPIGIIYFLIKKNYKTVVLLIIVLLYLYVISGNKAVYFTTFIVLSFFFLGRDYITKIKFFFYILLALFLVSPILDFLFFEEPIFKGTFVNRLFFIPSLLTQWYFEFFEGKPFYFAESHFFNIFSKSPYDMPVGYLLTKIHWNEPTVFANNGIVSDGFMNLGYFGVILFSFIFATLFGLFNCFKLGAEYLGLFFSYIFIILSAPLLTCFITGGIMLFIVLYYLVINESDSLNNH